MLFESDRESATAESGHAAWSACATEGATPPCPAGLPFALAAMFGQVSVPMVIIDQEHRIRLSNRAAAELFEPAGPLAQVGDRLRATRHEEHERLTACLCGAFTGRRTQMRFESPDGARMVAILPLAESGSGAAGFAGLVAERSRLVNHLGLHFFSRSVGLTHGEETILAELARGGEVADAASRHGIRTSTARTHVRHILAKTGHSSLRALTARLGMLPPLACRIGDDRLTNAAAGS